MKIRIAAAAAAALMMTAAAGAASAATYLTLNPPASDGSITGVFGNDGASGAGTFTDTFNFSLPSAGDLVASFSTSATKVNGKINPATDINFLSATLDGQSISLSPTGQFEFGNIDIASLSGPQTLVVNFSSGGKGATYAGTLAFTPGVVPEAGAWALMILGFGAAGALLRQRRLVLAV